MDAIELRRRINEAANGAEEGHELAQVCLWFADTDDPQEMEDGYYGDYTEIVPVSGASVTTHAAGGGMARGGDHVDYDVGLSEWRDKPEAGQLDLAKQLLDAACEYAYENLACPDSASQSGSEESGIMADRVVWSCTWAAWEIHRNNGTIETADDWSARHDEALEIAEIEADDSGEDWSADVIGLDPIHEALRVGDVAVCAGYGCDVYFVRFED